MSARSTLQAPLDLVTTSTGTLLSQALGVSRGAVRIQSSARARTKAVEIEGLSAPGLQSRLVQILEGTR